MPIALNVEVSAMSSPGKQPGEPAQEIRMRAAVVFEIGKPPVYSEFKEATPSEGEVRAGGLGAARQ